MPKRKNKYITRQKSLVSKQKEHNRIEHHVLIDNRRGEVEEVLFEKSKNFKKHNLLAKAPDLKKDLGIVGNKTLKQIRAGFVSTKDKEKYISVNKEHIKNLPIGEQRNLITMFLDFL